MQGREASIAVRYAHMAGGASSPGCSDLGAVRATLLAGTHAWGGLLLERITRRPLLPVLGRPLITHLFEWFAKAGIERASVCANGDTPVLRRRLRDKCLNVQIDYYQDIMPRGPAGSLRDSAIDTGDSVFVVSDASTLPCFDLRDLLVAHSRSGAVATVVTMPSECAGIVRPDLATPAGIYICSHSVLSYIQETGYQDIKEGLLSALYAKGKPVVTYSVAQGDVLSVRDASSYVRANHALLVRLLARGYCPPNYRREGHAWIHQSAEVHATARLIGPVMVGPEVKIEAGAVVVGPVVIGAGSEVGASAVVSRSVLWRQCCLEEDSTVDCAILTDRAYVGRSKAVRSCVRFASADTKRSQSSVRTNRNIEEWDACLEPIQAEGLTLPGVEPELCPVTTSHGAPQAAPIRIGATQPFSAESH